MKIINKCGGAYLIYIEKELVTNEIKKALINKNVTTYFDSRGKIKGYQVKLSEKMYDNLLSLLDTPQEIPALCTGNDRVSDPVDSGPAKNKKESPVCSKVSTKTGLLKQACNFSVTKISKLAKKRK